MDRHEIELIRRAQQGDTRAFDELVSRHDRRVLQTAYSMLGNLQEAQDVYQEAFLRAFTKIGSFRFESAFATWLIRIVVNLAITRRRQRWRRKWFSFEEKHENQPGWEDRFMAPEEQNPEKTLLSKELLVQLENALSRLPARQRAVFVLKHLQGYKITEIAGILDCAEGTVKNYLFRATRRLQKMLLPYYTS